MANILLQMKHITKTFPGVKALDDVNLTVEEGQIHGLVGENGAGKSTLMNVLSGVYPFGSYEGDIEYRGEVCQFGSIRDSEKKGIVIIHQELALIPYLTIGENMFLANERLYRKGVIDWNKTYHDAEKYMRMVGLHESSHTLIKDVSASKQQMVEIAKALSKNVKLLILDEPTSYLNEHYSKKLLELLLRFKKERGITSIIISHKLYEVSFVADKITVIRDGRVIETINKHQEEISEDRIVTDMVGRVLTERFPSRKANIGNVAVEIKNWTVHHPLYTERKMVDNVSISVRKGEIVGVAGLIGAGRTELCQSVFGKLYGTRISGKLYKDGKQLELNTVSQAIENGFAYVTEDRKGDGLILSKDLVNNITLARLEFVSKKGVIDKSKEKMVANEYKEKLSVKVPDIFQLVGNLSGGNQQKVLLAKWLYAQPDFLMLDEPTRGIDVGSKYEIYCIMNQLVAEGKSVLMVSSEMAELLGMCDRIYVMYEGKLIGELMKEEASQDRIMDMILQASKGENVL